MIEDAQKMTSAAAEEYVSQHKGISPTARMRRLSALEIAEGALLADVALVFHLLVRYLPLGGSFVSLLIPVIFAVIVLRRGLYVGVMSMFVALFLIILVLGPGGAPLLLLETGAGLFLGVTMRVRLGHVLTITLGIVLGALALWTTLLLFLVVSGGTHLIVRFLSQGYTILTALFALIFRLCGLGEIWQQHLAPLFSAFLPWGLQNWWIFLYICALLVCIPLVIGVYLLTNFFLRLLGYTVRPFPGYRLEGVFHWLVRWFFKLIPRGVLVRSSMLQHGKRAARRLHIAHLRQKRLEKERREII